MGVENQCLGCERRSVDISQKKRPSHDPLEDLVVLCCCLDIIYSGLRYSISIRNIFAVRVSLLQPGSGLGAPQTSHNVGYLHT